MGLLLPSIAFLVPMSTVFLFYNAYLQQKKNMLDFRY